MADGLGAALDAAVDLPRLPEEDMSVEAWAAAVRAELAALGPDDLVVAHSFAATILVHVVGAGVELPTRAVLLAMPDWGPDGWDIPAYALAGPEPAVGLSLHHCRDDEVVPFSHLALNAARLPSARVHGHRQGGHQFHGLFETIAADARSAG